jgi:outer membrane lipoprotein SlyB
MKHNLKMMVLLLSSMTALSSCARQISSDVYTSRQVGEVSTTYAGCIRSVREVCMEEGDKLEDNTLGMAGGGVVGGVAGNAIGKGGLVPTALGAVAGAVAGTFIEKKLKQQMALEYIVQLENSNMITVVQGQDQVFDIGQPVYVIISQSGRSRIISQ